MDMETLGRDFENNNSESSESGQSFDEDNYEVQKSRIAEEKKSIEETQQKELNNKMNELKKLEVQEFIGKNCVEPIEGVNTIVPYKELLESLIKSAEDEFKRVKSSGVGVESEKYKDAFEIKNKLELFKKSKEEKLSDEEKEQIKNIAKDKRLYELPVYKQLIEKGGFILPSDVRDYYDSAEQASVYHLGIDYNVKAGTEVKSMYNGEVVWSGYTGGGTPGESSLGHKVIIRHNMPDGTEFYSLYGHLGKNGLVSPGTHVEKGDIVGKVGEALTDENGNWQAHLHFQIMEDEKSPEGYSKNEGEGNYDVLKSFGK